MSWSAVLRGLVALALVGAVLWGGATRPPATLALAALSALALALAALEAQRERRELLLPPYAVPLLVAAGLTALELVPLPAAARRALSPLEEGTRALVLGDLDAGGLRPLAVDVPAALHALARLLGLGAFAVVVGRLSSERHRAFLRAALFAALAALLAPGLLVLLGVPVPPPLAQLESVRGLVRFPLANPNHAGALLALGLPLAVAQLVRSRGAQAAALGVLVALGNLALACTVSRGAILAGGVAQALVVAQLARSGGSGARRLWWGALAVAALALAAAGPALVHKLASTRPTEEVRARLWSDLLPMVREHWLFGLGPGGFPFVVTRYSPLASRLRFAFAENEYLQVAIDYGLAGALVLLGAAVWLLRRAARVRSDGSLGQKAALVGLLALAAQSAVDFGWEGGAVATAALTVAAIAFGPSGLRLPALGAGGLVLLPLGAAALALLPLGRTAEADGATLLAAARRLEHGDLDGRRALVREGERVLERHPADSYSSDVVADALLAAGDLDGARWLERALLDAPHDPIAHRLAARVLVMAGERDHAALELEQAFTDANDFDLEGVYDETVRLFNREGRDDDGPRLEAAVPPRFRQAVLFRLRQARRPHLVEALGRAALATDAANPTVLGWVLEAALERGDAADLAPLARRLAASDPQAPAQLAAARALTAAGQPDEARGLLDAAFASAEGEISVELAEALVGEALSRGDLARAVQLCETALARAVEVAHKARLHRLRATVEDKAGHPNRAALERAEAARLARH